MTELELAIILTFVAVGLGYLIWKTYLTYRYILDEMVLDKQEVIIRPDMQLKESNETPWICDLDNCDTGPSSFFMNISTPANYEFHCPYQVTNNNGVEFCNNPNVECELRRDLLDEINQYGDSLLTLLEKGTREYE